MQMPQLQFRPLKTMSLISCQSLRENRIEEKKNSYIQNKAVSDYSVFICDAYYITRTDQYYHPCMQI